jgi:hypothetical protein
MKSIDADSRANLLPGIQLNLLNLTIVLKRDFISTFGAPEKSYFEKI